MSLFTFQYGTGLGSFLILSYQPGPGIGPKADFCMVCHNYNYKSCTDIGIKLRTLTIMNREGVWILELINIQKQRNNFQHIDTY